MHQEQYAFVLEYLKTSDKAAAYRTATGLSHLTDETALEGANLMMSSPEVAGAIEDVEDNVRVTVLLEMETNLPPLLTDDDKRAILAEIARGRMKALAIGFGEKCCTCGMSDFPSIDQIIRAIKKDCRPCISRAYMMMMTQRIDKERQG